MYDKAKDEDELLKSIGEQLRKAHDIPKQDYPATDLILVDCPGPLLMSAYPSELGPVYLAIKSRKEPLRLIIVSDNDMLGHDSLLKKILEEKKMPIIKSLEEDIELMLHGQEATPDDYKNDFIEQKQKESWLQSRLAKPRKNKI